MRRGRPKKVTSRPFKQAGEAGWPTGSSLAEIEHAKGPFPRRRVYGLKKSWRAGNAKAVALAVQLCHEHSIIPPLWLVEATTQLVEWHLAPPKGRPKKRRGPRPNDEMHFRRWDEIRTIYDMGIEETLDKAYQRAVANLADTEDAGSYEAMRESYLMVERAYRAKSLDRFFLE